MIIKNNDNYDMESLLDSINDIKYQTEIGSMSKSEGLDLLNKCCVGFLSVENDNPIECEMFNYLDELRESGDTNMWGATPYIQDKFGMSNKDSKLLLVKWMERGAS